MFCSCSSPSQALVEEPQAPRIVEQAVTDADVVAHFEVPAQHNVTIAGHLYGLSVKTMKGIDEPLVYKENVMAAYAAEVQRLNPVGAFHLGDLTRYSTEAEWAIMDRIWSTNTVRNFWVAGNHDLRRIPIFEAHGGLRNKVAIIGRNKYLCLDAKNIFEAHDLAFIKKHLADHLDYDNVFILMHFRLMNNADPTEEGVDPYKGYTGKSNWNRDVVPLLLGKVRYVFTGDHYARNAMRNIRAYGDQELFYVHTSFQYRFQGPMVFLELNFDGKGDFTMEPRVVPLDLRDDWYEDKSQRRAPK